MCLQIVVVVVAGLVLVSVQAQDRLARLPAVPSLPIITTCLPTCHHVIYYRHSIYYHYSTPVTATTSLLLPPPRLLLRRPTRLVSAMPSDSSEFAADTTTGASGQCAPFFAQKPWGQVLLCIGDGELRSETIPCPACVPSQSVVTEIQYILLHQFAMSLSQLMLNFVSVIFPVSLQRLDWDLQLPRQRLSSKLVGPEWAAGGTMQMPTPATIVAADYAWAKLVRFRHLEKLR